MGCRIRGWGGWGVTVVLGETDVALAKPKPRPGGKPPRRCEKHLGRVPTAGGGGRQLPGGDSRSPLSRWTTSTRPRLRRALGMGDDARRGQKDGLVVVACPAHGFGSPDDSLGAGSHLCSLFTGANPEWLDVGEGLKCHG